MNQELKLAQTIINEVLLQNNLTPIKIILFGSRARGNFNKDSDYDFFIIINKDLTFSEKAEVNMQIRRKLAENKISCDVILQSEKKFEERKDNVGYLSYYVSKEGIIL